MVFQVWSKIVGQRWNICICYIPAASGDSDWSCFCSQSHYHSSYYIVFPTCNTWRQMPKHTIHKARVLSHSAPSIHCIWNNHIMHPVTPPPPPSSVATSILAGQSHSSNIIQRLPRVELTNHLGTAEMKHATNWSVRNYWELTNHPSRTWVKLHYNKYMLEFLRAVLTNQPSKPKQNYTSTIHACRSYLDLN